MPKQETVTISREEYEGFQETISRLTDEVEALEYRIKTLLES